MKKYLLVVFSLFLLFSASGHATYTTATIISNDAQEDGRAVLKVRFSGNAGEPAVDRSIVIDGNTTALSLRQWAIAQRDALNGARTLSRAAALQPGQTVDLTALPGQTPPTQAELDKRAWQEKANRLANLEALGPLPAGALADAVAALRADVAATFTAAYLVGF